MLHSHAHTHSLTLLVMRLTHINKRNTRRHVVVGQTVKSRNSKLNICVVMITIKMHFGQRITINYDNRENYINNWIFVRMSLHLSV